MHGLGNYPREFLMFQKYTTGRGGSVWGTPGFPSPWGGVSQVPQTAERQLQNRVPQGPAPHPTPTHTRSDPEVALFVAGPLESSKACS